MRIKFLKPVPGEGGKFHQPGEFLTVADDAVAKQYISLAYAEEAPAEEAPDISAITDRVVAELVKELKGQVGKAVGPNVGRIEAGESPEDKRKSFGRQLQLIGIACNDQAGATERNQANDLLAKVYGSTFRSWGDDAKAKASAQVESSGPLGGYGVFPQYSSEVYKIAIEGTVLASRAKKVPMSSNTLLYPKLDQTGTNTAGTYSGYLGGVIAGWSRETQNPAQTNAKLKQGVLKAGELMGYTQISNEVIADNSIGLESMITQLFGDAISYYIDLATLVGDGVDKPLGVNNAAATLSFTRTTSSHVKYADLVGMKSQLLPQSLTKAFWVANQTVMPELYNMVDASSRLVVQPYYPGTSGGPATVNLPETLLGLPLVFTEKTPALGTTGDIMLIDPNGYLLGERMGLEIAASPHVAFLAREMTYRFVARVAGQPVLDTYYTMLDGTNKLSTFTKLTT